MDENEHPWHDAVDFSPLLVCEVELSSGEIVEAVFVCGTWETLNGEAVYPVRFRPTRYQIVVGLYKYTPGGDS